MITVFFQGGLGNQMFQYAAGRAVAERLGTELRFDTSWYYYPVKRRFLLGEFGIKAPTVKSPLSFISNFVLKKPFFELVRSAPVYRVKGAAYDPEIFGAGNPSVLVGYFQSEKYFKDIETVIRDVFSFRSLPREPCVENWLSRIKDTCSVAVHVRRGDYLKHPEFNVCTESYYRKAIAFLKGILVNPLFYFFSDDLEWCRKTFQDDGVFFCDAVGSEASPLHDLHLIASCRHHILSNSTFSWWGAWLGKNSDQLVVVPKIWLVGNEDANDIPCENWFRLPC